MKCLLGAAALIPALALAVAADARQGSPSPGQLRTMPAPETAPSITSGNATLFAMDVPDAARPRGERRMLFGGWQPNDRTMIGVGLFSVPKSATADPQEARIDQRKDPSGKTSRVAAVGLSFRF